jgi:hypothetical protein
MIRNIKIQNIINIIKNQNLWNLINVFIKKNENMSLSVSFDISKFNGSKKIKL